MTKMRSSSVAEPESAINHADTIVVGGGISGLTAAMHLQTAGLSVVVLDKGYGLGGRLATRSLTPVDSADQRGVFDGVFDYGAQFFCVTDSRFGAWIEQLRAGGIVTAWGEESAATFQAQTGLKQDLPSVPYRGVAGNRAIATHLAAQLRVFNQTRVKRFEWTGNQWEIETNRIETEEDIRFRGKSLILTPPVPQTLLLLEKSNLSIPQTLRSRLSAIHYAPCLALMILFDRPLALAEPGGRWIGEDPLDWIASNRIKGLSGPVEAVTLHATPAFSETHFEDPPDETIEHLLAATRHFLYPELLADDCPQAIITRLHRWRYSQAKTCFRESCAIVAKPGPMVFAGDGFGKVSGNPYLSVERAYLSGLSAAEAVLP